MELALQQPAEFSVPLLSRGRKTPAQSQDEPLVADPHGQRAAGTQAAVVCCQVADRMPAIVKDIDRRDRLVLPLFLAALLKTPGVADVKPTVPGDFHERKIGVISGYMPSGPPCTA